MNGFLLLAMLSYFSCRDFIVSVADVSLAAVYCKLRCNLTTVLRADGGVPYHPAHVLPYLFSSSSYHIQCSHTCMKSQYIDSPFQGDILGLNAL